MLTMMLALHASEPTDRQFMENVYLHHARLMYAVAWRYADSREAADEIVQESVTALIGKVQTLRTLEKKPLRVYIAQTVRSKAVTYAAREGRIPTIANGQQVAGLPDRVSTEERILYEESLREALAAMHQLPDKEQQVLRLKVTTDMSNDDIARSAGIAPESVRQYLSRARRKVAKMVFGKEGAT